MVSVRDELKSTKQSGELFGKKKLDRINPKTQQQETYLNGENIESEIRVNPRVASVVSDVSVVSGVK